MARGGDLEIDRVVQQLPELTAARAGRTGDLPNPRWMYRPCAGWLPAEADTFTTGGFTFEIVDMDRQRIDKMIIRRLP